jgi:Na+/melibiose symporter-like transporter
MECAFEYFVAILVSGSFLAKLLQDAGFSDAMTGIISSFITLAFLFQLLSIFVIQKVKNIKRFAIFFHMMGNLFFMSMYFVPFLPFAKEFRQLAIVGCILIAYFGNYFVTSVLYKWGNSFVDPHKRASYSAGKEMISLITGIVVTLIVGYALDYYEAEKNLDGGFLFVAIGIFIFAACDFLCLMLIKNDMKQNEERHVVPLRTVMKKTLGNKNFVSVIILTIIWDVARYTTLGFLGTYNLTELAFTVGTMQLINIAGSLGRFAMSKPFGRYSDKHSYATGITLGMSIAAAGFGVLVVTSTATRLLIIVYTILYNVSLAGVSQNLFNITYSYVESEYFVQASALKNSIGGIFGFCASLLAGALLNYIQSNGNMLFGIHVYGQQVLALISFVLTVIAMLFTHFVIEKQKVMVQ